jgi:hypothetical protein
MNKSYLLIPVFLLFSIAGLSQFQQLDETLEIFGLRLMAPVDYKQLDYYKTANDNSFNIYKIINKKIFTGNGYTISDAYVIVKKGLIWYIIIPVDDSMLQKKISDDFIASGFKQHFVSLDGKNIGVDLLPFGSGDAFWISPHKSIESIIAKDNSGVTDLIGKKYSDPALQQFISSLGKNEKKQFDNSYELDGQGFYMIFNGDGEEATLRTITIYLEKDNYYYSKAPFKTSIKLPYDISATTTMDQLTDLFGEKDKSDFSFEMKFSKFKIKVLYGQIYSKKSDGNRHLISLTIE